MAEPRETRALTRFRRLAGQLDARFRIPGTPIRFGWDALLGLIPGLGDSAAGLVGAYGLWTAYSLGAPGPVLARMLLNLGIDLAFGLIPLAGDLFDVAWRGNLRNLALLERWLENPRGTGRRSTAVLLTLGLALLALLAGTVLAVAWLVGTLLAPR